MSASNTPAQGQQQPPAPPRIVYAFGEGGIITRTDEDSTVTVATFKESGKDRILVLVEEHENFRPAIVRWLNEQEKAPTAIYREGDEPAKKPAKEIPPMPKKDMRLGDKTPAVVAWYKKYHPEQYRARYGIIGEGTVTKYREEIDPKQGGKVKVPYEVDALIARRKIQGTEKLEANEANVTGEYLDESSDE